VGGEHGCQRADVPGPAALAALPSEASPVAARAPARGRGGASGSHSLVPPGGAKLSKAGGHEARE
jgi:hypothetical protein